MRGTQRYEKGAGYNHTAYMREWRKRVVGTTVLFTPDGEVAGYMHVRRAGVPTFERSATHVQQRETKSG